MFINQLSLILLILKQRQNLIMQANQSRRQTKTKYVQPPVFSVSNANKLNNPAHCRSLVDLNSIDTSSAEKENRNIDHYSSVISNQENKQLSTHKFNTTNNNGSSRQALANHKNISNIAKILLNANTTKSKQNLDISKNNSFMQSSSATTQNLSQNVSQKNKLMVGQSRKNQVLSHIVSNHQLKMQARTSSQTHFRENNMSHSNNKVNLFQQKHQLSVEKDRSQRSLNKSSKKIIEESRPKQRQRESQDYNLIIKLKEYIQDLKQKQHRHLQQIKQLSQQIHNLKQETVFLHDKVKVYQIRQKQMVKKLKSQQYEINSMKNSQKGSQSHHSRNECHEHQLIIQSLKNVINEQMSKIIELETYKVQVQQQKQRNSFNKQEKEYWQKNMESSHKESQYDEASQRGRGNFQEVYSFKKRNNLNESSIYIEDENSDQRIEQPHSAKNSQNRNQQQKKSKNSYSSIPQPYNELIKSLKSDSRVRSKNHGKQQTNQQSMNESFAQSEYTNTQEQNQQSLPTSNQSGQQKQKTQCSQDQILQEVGQYLSYIRKNVRDT